MSNPDAENLRRLLDPGTEPRLDQLECFPELDSTNRYLLDQAGPAAGRFRVAMTDHQTAGRGRRGKTWRTPPLSSICLSLAYTFRRQPRQLSSLSLAAGIAAVDVLRNLPMQGVALKWPNDLMAADAKLGGILVETRGNSMQTTAVIGLGINIDLTGFDHADIAPDRIGPITDLKHCVEEMPSRGALACKLIDSVARTVQQFDAEGFAAFVERWNRCDWLKGRQMSIETAAGRISGAAEGVDDDGGLLLMTQSGPRTIVSGSVILAPNTGAG